MDSKSRHIVLAIVGGLIGASAGWMIVSNIVSEIASLNLYEQLLVSSIVGLLSGGFSVWFDSGLFIESEIRNNRKSINNLRTEIVDLQGSLDGINLYGDASKFVNGLPKSSPNILLKKALNNSKDDLRKICEGKYEINKDEVMEWWELLIDSADKSVVTTNLVRPSSWDDVAKDGTGGRVQKNAVNSGVDICRFNVANYGACDSVSDEEKYEALIDLHESAGVIVEEVDFEELKTIRQLRSTMNDLSEDIVLVDDEVILMTTVSFSCDLVSSTISVDEHDVSEAITFFTRIIHNTFNLEDDYTRNPFSPSDIDHLDYNRSKFLNTWFTEIEN